MQQTHAAEWLQYRFFFDMTFTVNKNDGFYTSVSVYLIDSLLDKMGKNTANNNDSKIYSKEQLFKQVIVVLSRIKVVHLG